MAPPKAFPGPEWLERHSECLRCGYALAGLTDRRCPECGTPFDDRVLVLRGVAGALSGAPMWRRWAWAAVIVAGLGVSQSFGVVMITGAWVISAAVFGVVVLGGAALVATSPRERRGVERFVFTPGGVARLPIKPTPEAGQDSIFIPYGPADAVSFKRVSNVWRRMRIGERGHTGSGFSSVRFDAGVFCPDDLEPRVRETIETYMRGGSSNQTVPVTSA